MEKLLEVRRQMALEVDYDVDLFAEVARSGNRGAKPRLRPADRMNGKSEVRTDEAPELIKSCET